MTNQRLKEINAKEIAEMPGICQINKNTFFMPSQTYANRKYVVKNEGFRWVCTCLDNYFSKRECKHILAAKIFMSKMPKYEKKEILKVHKTICPFCGSDKFIKNGHRNTSCGKKQRYLCTICNRRFIDDIVKNIKGNSYILVEALSLYFNGMSFRQISDHFHQGKGFEIHHSTLYRWTVRFCRIMSDYTDKMYPAFLLHGMRTSR